MELRGYDSYTVTLGDEMRGERATLGKTLEDTERDLRIKARMIVAIESCDLSGFPNPSVIAGYVRSYARYLHMDPEDCYLRFCEESGFKSPAAMMSNLGDGSAYGSLRESPLRADVGAEIGLSRFAAPPVTNRFRARIPLGALTSSIALIGLVAGLGYGGYSLLQDFQRVGFAPLPEAPVVVADAPRIEAVANDIQDVVRPAAEDYRGGGVLAAIAAPAELVPTGPANRDGPISAINPETAGMFARLREELPEAAIALSDPQAMAQDVAVAERAAAPAEADAATLRGVVLHAVEESWIRVVGRGNAVLFEGILGAGQRFDLPERVDDPVMIAGNAGGTYVSIDGRLYGPFGGRGRVAKNVSLAVDDIRAALPAAELATVLEAGAGEQIQQATARLTRP